MNDIDELSHAMERHAEELKIFKAPAQAEPDLTALSHWFPKIQAAGLPVPRTKIVPMSRDAQGYVVQVLWGDNPPLAESFTDFISELSKAAEEMGLPCFLRTDHTSNKHDWQDSCFLTDTKDLARQVFNIAQFSEICGMPGLPYDNWVIRSLLPTKPFGVCPLFGNMPICREFRFFVNDGDVICAHPYWPLHALQQGGASENLDFRLLCYMSHSEEKILLDLASRAGKAVGGSWSVDVLETESGWFVTDMAEAQKIYHWEGCKS